MFQKVSRLLKYDSTFFFVHKHIYLYMDTSPNHINPRSCMWGKYQSGSAVPTDLLLFIRLAQLSCNFNLNSLAVVHGLTCCTQQTWRELFEEISVDLLHIGIWDMLVPKNSLSLNCDLKRKQVIRPISFLCWSDEKNPQVGEQENEAFMTMHLLLATVSFFQINWSCLFVCLLVCFS